MAFSRLLCLGLIIHLILLISIFDIYFKSPIIAGITAEPNMLIPMGKRVVLISVDGLRVDSLFDKDPATGKHVADYMLSIIKTRGTWGMSQSHVPTESRPGHVAMLAGFYEDPSAVTKGWKENPVDFDSIFNRSHCSFAWGSPDILNIFFKGLKHNCAFMESYSSEQNFAGDTREYDNWVFEKLQDFLKFSKNSLSLYSEGIFFFLHLLGQDTSGHSHKPHTEKYRQNLQNVDLLVEKVENLFYDFYGDDRTTFIFTSDHGMTDWGSHGTGDVEETNTPFIAWGAGIKKPTNPIRQININQADITPLLAVLLGASIPVNSVGVLPISYLNMSKRQIAEAVFLNAKQIVAQYAKLLQDTEENIISWFHFPFEGLQDVSSKFSSIIDAIKSEKYLEAIVMSKNMIQLGLEGLNYYQNYWQKTLLLCISLSYLGWIFYLLLELFRSSETKKRHKNPVITATFCCAAIVTVSFIAIQKLPFSFYFYAILPELLWFLTIKKTLTQYVTDTFSRRRFLFVVLVVLAGVEILVVSFFYRWCLCISIGLMLMWSLTYVDFRNNKCLMVLWLFSGSALGFFSLLPIVGGQPNPFLTSLSGICLCFLSVVSAWYTHYEKSFVFSLQCLGLILSTWNNYVVHSHFNENQELLDFNKHISWILLVLSISLLLIPGRTAFLQKLFQVCISLSIPFLLLSVKHEGFFMFFLFIHLFCWVNVEKLACKQSSTTHDFRIAYFFLVYVFISFFGLGNITSLNSFDPAWVRCFVTVFSPFLMSALILFKTIIPLLVVTCTLRTVTNAVSIRPRRLFVIILMYCNIMGLNFLFLVRNKGSWLDIGTSISHYVIQQVTVVFLVFMFGVAKLLIKDHSEKRNQSANKDFNIKVLLPTYRSLKDHSL